MKFFTRIRPALPYGNTLFRKVFFFMLQVSIFILRNSMLPYGNAGQIRIKQTRVSDLRVRIPNRRNTDNTKKSIYKENMKFRLCGYRFLLVNVTEPFACQPSWKWLRKQPATEWNDKEKQNECERQREEKITNFISDRDTHTQKTNANASICSRNISFWRISFKVKLVNGNSCDRVWNKYTRYFYSDGLCRLTLFELFCVYSCGEFCFLLHRIPWNSFHSSQNIEFAFIMVRFHLDIEQIENVCYQMSLMSWSSYVYWFIRRENHFRSVRNVLLNINEKSSVISNDQKAFFSSQLIHLSAIELHSVCQTFRMQSPHQHWFFPFWKFNANDAITINHILWAKQMKFPCKIYYMRRRQNIAFNKFDIMQ